MEGHTIDISGLDKQDLLYRMWQLSRIDPIYTSLVRPWYHWDGAQEALERGYIDSCYGRPIKCNLSGDTVNSRLYDRYAGEGTLARIVQEMREEKK